MTLSANVGSETAAVTAMVAGVSGGYLETTATSVTLTAAQTVDALINQTGGTTNTATTPTAAALVAAIPGCAVGSKFDLVVRNGGSGAFTLAGGSGVTVAPIATVAAAKTRAFKGVVTNVGSPAVSIFALAELA